ncbi:DUF1631 family protein [Ideonella sp. BN130291]|uniref:DUF1631 family protein n=1 Tax=Ideonella sp. BN130291 TaxID=3112940 RepID=UPI002E26D111|nr:DUF1631 family protein [Ideonella sp. BN130291]
MNLPLPRYQAALQAALQRIKQAARLAAERSVDSLGLAALSATSVRERDDLLSAQFELNKRLAQFTTTFNDTLDRRVARATAPRGSDSPPTNFGKLPWESLSLVGDHEVEAQVMADRFSLTILHDSEWELRELDAYMGSLLQLSRPDHERNPLRPEAVGLALVAGTEVVSERPEVRKLLTLEIGRGLTGLIRTAYADIVNDLRSAGVQPLSLTLRPTSGARSSFSGHGGGSGNEPGDTLGLATESGSIPLSTSGASTRQGGPGSTGRQGLGSQWGGGSGHGARSGTFGQVDAQLMTLIRRLAFLGNVPDPGASGGGVGADGFRSTAAGATAGGSTLPLSLPNLIVQHRDELRQASTGTLDHMVIDVVGSLFDQILSDPKVPPQMARQIARLQLPVLRVALGDVSFFSSRRHPVRRFVNRIASLACAFEDFNDGPGQHFLGLVKELVQEIVTGDFDQMEVYERKLASLENFIAEQTEAEVREQGDAATLLQRKESELLQQQRYMQQLQAALAAVEMHDFLRDFLAQVWSQAIVQAQRKDDGGALADKLRRAGRDLVMSVQPKGAPADRKAFLLQLPQLMKDLNEGLATIGWPESAKKSFFAQLLPAHAESLKGQSMRQLDYNLLVKQLDTILGAPLPKPGDLPPAGVLPVLDQVVPDLAFTAAEAAQVGLVAESSVDWSGQVDIDLSAEPALTEVDINIDGLPAAEPTEPTQGASLADHVQLGFAYQMHVEGQWQKVRLSYVSPGRAFFVFTRGKKHQKTISLTHRMLVRLCETGRMRAFENAYLIERATARARRQLAALSTSGAVSTRH